MDGYCSGTVILRTMVINYVLLLDMLYKQKLLRLPLRNIWLKLEEEF